MTDEARQLRFTTRGGIDVLRRAADAGDGAAASAACRKALDGRRGALFYSNYEYPGRYTRWDVGFVDPPLCVTARGRDVEVLALNPRGQVLLAAVEKALSRADWHTGVRASGPRIDVRVGDLGAGFTEEERLRRPTVFSLVRELCDLFGSASCEHLGLYGAFGYDLTFQFDPIVRRIERPSRQRDMVLYLPDTLTVVDHYAGKATVYSYDFAVDGRGTAAVEGGGESRPFTVSHASPRAADHEPGEYAEVVRKAIAYFERGDLFEAVPGQVFLEPCRRLPSQISETLVRSNPSPYGFVINLGESEHLVGSSPEMFVRVAGRRIETCPISGTISRGADAMADADQVRILLNSAKDEAELTMCSDVDRNDKSRVCVPGSVKVIGRRQIEMYSRLIHTVDHIEGQLLDRCDALDGFLSHAWAVTVTGAPKRRAMQFIEDHERSSRRWYGGAVGIVHFNGDLNTGLTLRTIRIEDGMAEVRAGATLLADSDPDEEERETHLKASALLNALRVPARAPAEDAGAPPPGEPVDLVLVDHDDSFVHTLANYFRQFGARVTTLRAPLSPDFLSRHPCDLVVLSPGPARPADFDMNATIGEVRRRGVPLFGVCLGLQGIAEAFGGTLDQLDVPFHGKPSRIAVEGQGLFADLPRDLDVGRYHSLVARRDSLDPALLVTATTSDGTVMAVEHASEPVTAVQFHPESIMSLRHDMGATIIRNVVEMARSYKARQHNRRT